MGIMCVSWFTFLPHTLDLLETWPMLYIAFEPVHCYYDYVGSIKTESGNLVTEIKDKNSIINVLCVYFVIILLHAIYLWRSL